MKLKSCWRINTREGIFWSLVVIKSFCFPHWEVERQASSQIGLFDLMNLKLSILTSFCFFFFLLAWSFSTWCGNTFYCQFHRISCCQLDSWSCLVTSAWFLCSEAASHLLPQQVRGRDCLVVSTGGQEVPLSSSLILWLSIRPLTSLFHTLHPLAMDNNNACLPF